MNRKFLCLFSVFTVFLLAPSPFTAAQKAYGVVPHEKFLYVGSVDMGGKDPDFMAVVGVDPSDRATYGKIVHRVDMLHIGDELHHFGYNHDKTKIMIPGLFSGRIYIVDPRDPARPVLESVYEELTKKSGYIVPHTVIGLPNGNNLVTMVGAKTETTAPGGMVELNGRTGEFVRNFGPPANRDYKKIRPEFMYDVGIKPEVNRMVTTSFGLPAKVGGGITIDGLGTDLYVWDWKAQKVLQRLNIGKGTGALEVRWRRKHGSTIGYTNLPGTDEVLAWEDRDGDGRYDFRLVIILPPGSVPTDMLLSDDDKYMYLGNWVGGNVMQYNIENPLRPRFVSKVDIPYAQMLRLSPDKKRLYVTNSLLSTWDDTEFPKGVTRNQKYGIFLVDVDHKNGGMKLNGEFHVDMMNVQKKNTVGPARPHMMLFDPTIGTEFGHH